MIREEYKYSEITEKIIGRAMKVHRWFGPGFPEMIYQRSLLIELEILRLDSKAEVEKDVFYNEMLVGKRRLDIIVEQNIVNWITVAIIKSLIT